MVTGMSSESDKAEWRRRLEANRDREKDEIQDWLNGPGQKVIAMAGVLIAGYVLVSVLLWASGR